MTTTHPVGEVEAYLADVRDRLRDLPEEERAELLDDIVTHVREVAEEHGPDQLRIRLGEPETFADELRASAGYASAGYASAEPTEAEGAAPPWRRVLPMAGFSAAGLAPHLKRLEPAWWLVRGGLVACFVLSGGDTARPIGGVGELVPHGVWYMGVVVAAAIASYLIGERTPDVPPRPVLRRIRIALEIALAIWGVALVSDQVSARTEYRYVDGGSLTKLSDPCLQDSAGRPIGNLYAYDTTGKLIPQVFLVDQAGRPIDNLCPEQAPSRTGPARTTYARDVNGSPVYNVFPRQQERIVGYDPATGAPMTEPVPPPAVLLPQVQPPAAAPPAAAP